jgi:hypothetical protein
MSRDSWALLAATIAVVAVAVLGFWSLGTPRHERQVHQDVRTTQALNTLAEQIRDSWNRSKNVLPPNLERFPDRITRDPMTEEAFIYHPKTGSQYELCARFLTDDRNTAAQSQAAFWLHPSGPYCFQLDAAISVPPPPYFYDY